VINENGIYIESGFKFDFSPAVFHECVDPPKNFSEQRKKDVVQGLSTVDFIVETEKYILFIEVKNPDCLEATEETKKEFFQKIRNNELMAELGRKFKDSLLRKYALGYEFSKPVKYICILQFDGYYQKHRNRFRKSIINDYIPKRFGADEFKGFSRIDNFEMPNINDFTKNYFKAEPI